MSRQLATDRGRRAFQRLGNLALSALLTQEFFEANSLLKPKVLVHRRDYIPKVYWLPVKRSVVDLAIESRLKLVESMAFVRLDF